MLRSLIPSMGLSLVLLSGCAPVVTRVVLLPDDLGKPSAVDVKTAAGIQRLSKPYQTAEIDKDGQVALSATDSQAVKERYGALLAQRPAAEVQFLLYFETGGAQLTAQSKAIVPEILTHARSRPGGEIIVLAHTDRVGSLEANDALSLRRAQAIRELCVAQGFKPDLVDAVGRGERTPVVATADEVAEPQNRRAEIIVR